MGRIPFLKWVGGKGRLLPRLGPLLPLSFTGTYWEPFLGGGAMFFFLRPQQAVLSDTNEELIRTYRAVREHPRDVAHAFERLVSKYWSPSGFAEVVKMQPGKMSDFAVAGRMLFLNRTAFNGLYRVNSKGQFNAPWGKYPQPTVLDLLDISLKLDQASNVMYGRTDIRTGDFEWILAGAEEGDFVYLDPPYVPLSETASFTSYAAGGFGPDDKKRLALLCTRLTKKGVRWMLSNSYNEVTKTLFDPATMPGVNHAVITAPRAVAAKSSSRSSVKELVIRNYT
ncbi:MAG: Dam family site-specific DNA-(adenine-N6)-methyltransferase [Veillonellaceae bacterium]|nr:Dam family site-specific DNA-(adenine-N6)-methyltransferase [Veillonellaceae bacterium]